MTFQANVLEFLRPGLSVDPVAGSDNCVLNAGEVEHWSHAVAQPTQQEHDDALADLTVVNGQTFSQWQAENGGDPILTARREALDIADGPTENSLSQEVRALLSDYNKRINYLTNRVIELQDTLVALQASGGNAGNRLDALPPSYLATATRPRADARQAVRDGLAAGEGDDN